MSRPARRSLLFSVALAAGALLAWRAAAHELDYQELLLYWDASSSQLRGQILTDPARVAADPAEPEARAAELLHGLAGALQIELDGAPCAPRFELRELWVRAGATLGDSVLVTCAHATPPRTLRVYAGTWLHGLRVSVQQLAGDARGEVITSRTALLAGTWSGVYAFADPRRGFHTSPAASSYLELGLRHIVQGGWDHLAFVAALVLGSAARPGRLFWQLTAFTLAHSLTLALGALGWVVLPRAAIELGIALSVVAVALSNLAARRRALQAAPLLAFAFGLLHGQGFAGNLLDAELPVADLLWAVLAFNVGVELGQGAWAGLLWLGLRASPGRLSRLRVVQLGSLALVGLGLYWTWERAGVLFGG